jgi:hypothetical protein
MSTITTTEAFRLLVVADIWCQIDGLCDGVRRELGDRGSDVVVIAPPLASWLHTLTSDIDHEAEAANDRLADVLGRLKERGVEARGIIGANDPVLAIDDALARFAAQKIVLITDSRENENWREHKLPVYLQGLDIPSVRVIVPHDQGVS